MYFAGIECDYRCDEQIYCGIRSIENVFEAHLSFSTSPDIETIRHSSCDGRIFTQFRILS
jgi:hypothetical protein